MHELPVQVMLTAVRGRELHRRFFVGKTIGIDESLMDRLLDGEIKDEDIPDLQKVLKEGPGCEGYRPEDPPEQLVRFMCYGGRSAVEWFENFNKIDDDRFSIEVEIEKVDSELGIVFGYAMVCYQEGQKYFDLHDDHITEKAMLECTAAYMEGNRIAKDMHQGEPCGQVVYGFPMTAEIAKSLDIQVKRTGFIVGMKPESQDMLDKFASGEYTGFSIGGRRVKDTEID